MFVNFLLIKICCSSQCYPLKPYNWQFLVKIPVTSIDNIIGSCGWKTGLSSHSIEFCYLPSSRFSSLHVNKFYSLRGEILTLNFWCCANALVSSSNYWTYWWVHCKIGFFSTVSTSTSSNTHLQLTRLVKQVYQLVFSWIVQANSCQGQWKGKECEVLFCSCLDASLGNLHFSSFRIGLSLTEIDATLNFNLNNITLSNHQGTSDDRPSKLIKR